MQLSAVGWKDCIAIGWIGWQIVLQYSLGQPVSQDGRLCRDTALGAQGTRGARRLAWGAVGAQACGAHCRRSGRAAGAAGARGARQQARARGAREAGLAGRQARGLGAGHAAWERGLALGCALDALGLFFARFDSVFFLSKFLDIVREPGS